MAFFGYFRADIFDCPPFEMFSNNDDPRAYDILEQRSFEPHSMKLWCRYARNATAILAIGAHTGVYALAACALRRDITVHAFEANPYTAARLRVNKHKNEFENLYDHFVALSSQKGTAAMQWKRAAGGRLSSGARLAQEKHEGGEMAAVLTCPLDSFDIPPGDKPLVKIDVEGAEFVVLKGMKAFLKAQPIILLETFRPDYIDAIEAMLPSYRFFQVQEDGDLIETPHLIAIDPQSASFNQLLLPPWAAAPAI